MTAIAGNVLVLACGLLLVASAGAKLAGVRGVVSGLEGFGFAGRVRLIGAGEAASALLFLLPPTRSLGVLLVSALLGGAIATHMQHRKSLVGPSAVLAMVWLGTWLAGADALWRLAGGR